MGNIDYLGIHQNYQEIAEMELTQCKIPENATLVYDNKESNDLNLVLFTIPIIIIILTIIIIKQKRNGFLNKQISKEIQEDNIAKHTLNTTKKKILFGLKNILIIYILFFTLMCFVTTIHEYLHAIAASLMGYSSKIAIGFPIGGATWVTVDMLKGQTLVFLLTPLFILGIIPGLYACIIKIDKKNYLKQWIIGLISCMMIFSCGYDIINSYNIMHLPNDSYIGQSGDVIYWYKD